MTDRDSARAAKERLRTELAPLDGVGGVGIGRRDGGYVVTVDVVDETDGRQVPSSWDGVDVEVRVVGRVRPLPAPSGLSPQGVPTGPVSTGPVSTGPAPGPRVTTGRGGVDGVRWRAAARDGGGSGR